MVNVSSSTQTLQDPMYEVGVYKPVNQKGKQIQTRIQLPIPKNVIFFREFKAGETLPIQFKAEGNLVKLDAKPQTLTFLQDIFVKATKDNLEFSIDHRTWQPFLKVFTGSIDAKIIQETDKDSPKAVIQLVANALGRK